MTVILGDRQPDRRLQLSTCSLLAVRWGQVLEKGATRLWHEEQAEACAMNVAIVCLSLQLSAQIVARCRLSACWCDGEV